MHYTILLVFINFHEPGSLPCRDKEQMICRRRGGGMRKNRLLISHNLFPKQLQPADTGNLFVLIYLHPLAGGIIHQIGKKDKRGKPGIAQDAIFSSNLESNLS